MNFFYSHQTSHLVFTVEDARSPLLQPGETVVFKSTVRPRTMRRHGSMLLHIPVPPIKPKARMLILTTERLLCLKLKPTGSVPTIKSRFVLRAPDKGKDSQNVITSAEPKGQREFVVKTVRLRMCSFMKNSV